MKHALSRTLRGSPARTLRARCRSACSRTPARVVVALPVAGVLVAVILALGLHVNLSASAPRGLQAGRLLRTALVRVGACERRAAGAHR
jgi:hypothetical protein